jgi:hypothetical protein
LRPLDARQPIVALIAVALQEPPAEALQESLGMLTAAARRIAKQSDRRTLATMAAIIARHRPEEALLGCAPRIEPGAVVSSMNRRSAAARCFRM